MNPNDTLPQTSDLPQPQAVDSSAVIAAPSAAAPSVAPPTSSPGWLPPTVPVNAAATSQPQQQAESAVSLEAPEEAEDSGLIEKEWVVKAKQIVEATSQDPYEQTKQLGKFKAEYMKKRYNKVIGSTED